MRTLSLLCMAMLVMILPACKKENISSSPVPGKKEIPAGVAPNFFKLPPNGQYVDLHFANGKKMSLYKVDTNYLLEYDMVLTPAQIEVLKANNASAGNTRGFQTQASKEWPHGRVYYAFNNNLSADDRAAITDAMNEWMYMVPSLQFIQRTNQPNFIYFVRTIDVSDSYVGMIGGGQVLNLATGDYWSMWLTAKHEIGHALGMFHEQSRTDRDDYITINWSNIRPEKHHNFQTYAETGYSGTQFGYFDFSSIMLYPSITTNDQFVFDTNIPTMTTHNGSTWGHNFWISYGDGETGQIMYGPPYAQANKVITSQSSDPMGESFDEYGYFIVTFYSDAACTQPYVLTEPKSITINNFSQYYSGGQSYYSTHYMPTITLPAGSSTFNVGEYHEYLNSYLGYTNSYEFHQCSVASGFGR
jgi:hypothetical protein